MTLDLLSGIITVLDNFPKHPLRIFEKILFFDIVKRITLLILDHLGILRHSEFSVGTTVVRHMIDPPVPWVWQATLGYSCYDVVITFGGEGHVKLLTQDVERVMSIVSD